MRVTGPKKMRRGSPKQRSLVINKVIKKKPSTSPTKVQSTKNGSPLRPSVVKTTKRSLAFGAKEAVATMKKTTTKQGKLGKVVKDDKSKTIQTDKKSPKTSATKTKNPKLTKTSKAAVPETKKKPPAKKVVALEKVTNVKENVKTVNNKEKDDSTLKATDGANVQHKEKIAPKIETKAKQNTPKQAIMNKIDKTDAKLVKAVARKSTPKKDISLVDRTEANKQADTNIKNVEVKDKVVKETSKLLADRKNTKTSPLETADNKTKLNENIVETKAETIAKLLKEANKTLLKGALKNSITPPKRKKKMIDCPKSNAIKKAPMKKTIDQKIPISKIKTDDSSDKKNNLTVKRKIENAKNFKKKIIETWSEKSKAEELQKQLKQELIDEALNLSLKNTNEVHIKKENKPKIKEELDIDEEDEQKSKNKKQNLKHTVVKSPKLVVLKKRILKDIKKKKIANEKEQKQARRKKIIGLGNGPKRHRVASLNALAKVHCLYENESRGAFLEILKPKRAETTEKQSEKVNNVETPVPSTRTLRSGPGVRGAGKHWDMHNEVSSSDESVSSNESYTGNMTKIIVPPSSYKQKQIVMKKPADKQKTAAQKQPIKKRRNCNETVMDLKDMVVRKRMASLNATAILAASYSPEKRSNRSGNEFDDSDTDDEEDDDDDDEDDEVMTDKRCFDGITVKEEDDRKLISNKKKVAVIVNQDTDVTITGVYVNSTTRSTHLHEGYCSIAGMQYRISATSHTQTNATAVSTETLQLHSAANSEQPVSGEQGAPMAQPCKSYTPLGALSSMQPPGAPPPAAAGPPLSPLPGRVGRHAAPCSSAFSAPPYGPPPPHHHHPPPKVEHPPPGYIHGYYQPAGPLISTHHPHGHVGPSVGAVIGPGSVNKISAPLPSLETSPASPLSQQPPAPSSAGESSDNDVIITASTSSGSVEAPHLPQPPQPTYRYATSYPTAGAPPGYAYSFPPAQYYTAPQYGPQQPPHYHHQDLCYSAPPYPTYFKAYGPPTGGYHRRYIPAPPPQYYPQDVFASTQGGQQTTQVVTAAVSTTGSAGPGGTFQSSSSGPPPTLVETFQPSSGPVSIVESYHGPPHYYAGFNTAPTGPPGCYTHTPPTRSLAFIDPAYQSCPCPMQSCPKNVHTGPLTGDGKRSNMTVIAKESTGRPLLPVALALPLEPTSVGPPSPARGSAGMPPPPSPAGATYQPASTPKQEATGNCSPALVDSACTEKSRRKARVGKNMVRNTIASHFTRQSDNTMLLMCHNPGSTVKREAISPEEISLVEKKEKEIENTQTQPSPTLVATNTVYNVRQAESPVVSPDIERSCESRLKSSPNNLEKDISTDEFKENNNFSNDTACCTEMLSNFKEELSSSPADDTQPVLSPSTDNSTNATSEKENTEISFEESLTNKKLGTKRKLIDDEENKNTVQKKHKSSYKDLIKKPTETFKINNGKRKLNANKKMVENRVLLPKKPKTKTNSKTKVAKPIAGVKRKSSPVDDDCTNTKKMKNMKALTTDSTNMLHNTKQNNKTNKLTSVGASLGLNLPSINKKCTVKKTDSSVTNNSNSKKIIPTNVEPSLKQNSIDQTIESVIQSSRGLEDLKTSLPPQNISKSSKENKASLTNINTNVPVAKSKEPECSNKPAVINTKTTKIPTKITKKRNSRLHKTKEYIPCPISKVPRRSSLQPRWSNGWSWEGEPFKGKVFLNSDESVVTRTCYPAMRHSEGDLVSPRDCVLLKSGPRKTDLPFVAKVASLWENPDDGEMMMSLLWYYRPEHTEQGRLSTDEPDEVFASRHKDTNSVACIEDKCYVLTFNEYCRYRKNARRIEEGLEEIEPVVPQPDGTVYPRAHRQPPSSQTTSPDMVFFCRRVYDFRQKRIVKNPS